MLLRNKMKPDAKIFLTAEWRKLIMANYKMDASVLAPYLPIKTEIDHWQNECYVSLVGFMFTDVNLKGIAVPFHTRFPEVNLRFYVRYKDGTIWKRGVVFISEIVPKPAIAWVANGIYKEKYSVRRMNNSIAYNNNEVKVKYSWKEKDWNFLEVSADKDPQPLMNGSNEEFITEHFWGYAKKNNSSTVEYKVEHPRWDIYKINSYTINCDFSIYGKDFEFLNREKPSSVFMAEGSPIKIFSKRLL